MEHLWLVTLKRGFYRLEPGVVVSSVYGWDHLASVEMVIGLLCIRVGSPLLCRDE